MPTQPGCWTMQSGIPFNMAQTWWMEVGFKFGWQKSNENSPSPRQSLVASTWLVNCTRSSGEFSAMANTEGEELEVFKGMDDANKETHQSHTVPTCAWWTPLQQQGEPLWGHPHP